MKQQTIQWKVVNNMFKGIDVSEHNGNINHGKIKASGIEFAMVRAGYGGGNVDKQFKRNMEGFINAGVHVGAYWFIYSTTVAEAIAEANHFDRLVRPYKDKMTFPVAADFEYDSERWMKRCGVTPSKRLNTDIVKAFCKRLEELGWYVVNYANIDYINNHFHQSELDRFDIWVAQWGVNKCSKACGIWQYTSDGKVPGSSARTDMNIAYKDYPALIKGGKPTTAPKPAPKPTAPTGSVKDIATDVMLNKYGIEDQRKKALGSRYQEVQDFINHIQTATDHHLADEVWADRYGTGKQRKILLGARYDAVQAIVEGKDSAVYYTVKKGDTLGKIAAKYNTNYKELARKNNIKNANLIYPGQKIKIR